MIAVGLSMTLGALRGTGRRLLGRRPRCGAHADGGWRTRGSPPLHSPSSARDDGTRAGLALILLIGATGWFGTSRLVRAEVLRLREESLHPGGGGAGRLAAPGYLPASAAEHARSLARCGHARVGDVILLEAGLSFLGLGIQPPAPSWGGMILDAREVLVTRSVGRPFPGHRDRAHRPLRQPARRRRCATPSTREAHDAECSKSRTCGSPFPTPTARRFYPVDGVSFSLDRGRNAGARRRIGLRQESDQPGAAPTDPAAGTRGAGQRHSPGRHRRARVSRATRCARSGAAGSG